jgi:pimeloyl-ACP methyl ester carboxylesterase
MLDTAHEIVNHRRLRVARLGFGDPLILLHGYPDNLQIWSRVGPLLADRYEVIAFDWPGMGYSDAWPGGATPFHMADRLVALMDHWNIERATIAGMDMGGQPALALAARNPDRVSSLVVMNSLVIWDEATSWEISVLRKFGWNRLIISRLPGVVFRRAERTFLPRGASLPSDARNDLWNAFKNRDVRNYIVRMCAGYQGALPRLPELYGKIVCPTLVLWAEHDKHFPVAHAERLHSSIPGSRLKIVAGGEHWMAWHDPETVATAIKETK